VCGIDSTCVHHVEDPSIPFGFPEETVARRPRRIVHDRHPFPDKTVEQRTFSYVGSAHKGNNWFWHSLCTSFS
jgi:hypothetical protein